MFSKLIEHLKKLPRDRVFRKSVLHFSLFTAVLTGFILLTTHHVITKAPVAIVPAEYSSLSTSTMDKVTLEQKLRTKDPEVQGLIFFKGLNDVVVMGNGLEHDVLVQNADVDEMRTLATQDNLPVIEKPAAVSTEPQDVLPAWWGIAVLGFVPWLYWLLFFKREKKQVHSRARVFFTTLPKVMNEIIMGCKTKPSRFYLYALAVLIVINGLAYGFRLYHSDHVYTVPPDIASAQKLQPWQAERHLLTYPSEFQRVTFVDELGTAYVVLNSKTVPIPHSSMEDDDDTPPVMVSPDGMSVSVPDTTPAPRAAVHPRPKAKAETAVKTDSNATYGHKPVTVDRLVVFPNTAAGKAEYAAFENDVHAKKIESKNVPAYHDMSYIDTMTVAGKIVFGTMDLLILCLGGFIAMMWSDWHDKEKTLKPGQFWHPGLVGAGGGAIGNGGSAVVTRDEDKKTFADVAGCQEAIDELKVVQKKIMRPRLYRIFGAPVPNGVIFYGPPGTGKTLLARALAGEVGGSFQALSGSEFVEMYVGVGAKRVREAYATARAQARKTGRVSIVFIDEFDALAKKRGTSNSGGDKEYEQTLNQLLVEMNGFGNHGVVLTMAATNRLDILDEAVLRPGRFDIKVKVPKPDRKGRSLIFGIYLKKLKLVLEGEGEVREANYQKLLDDLARRSHDFSGAEIEGSIKDGATIAVERQFGDVLEDITTEQEEQYRSKAIITAKDLHLGIDKMAYGTQIKSRVRTDKERKATSYHEIGHASVPTEMKGDPVNRITIVMTDKSLGLMDSAPEEGERYDWTDEQFSIRLHMMLAGRAAEKVLLKKISTGASNDFERASQLARQMVGVYGMSEAFGNKSIPLDEHGFPVSNIGETMLKTFNDAWGKIIDDAQLATEAFIEKHKVQIRYCGNALYDEETLTGDEFRRLWKEAENMTEEELNAREAAEAASRAESSTKEITQPVEAPVSETNGGANA